MKTSIQLKNIALATLISFSGFVPNAYAMERITVSSTGEEANNESNYPSISVDGNYVAFTSSADNLVPNDNNGSQDVFLKNLLTGEIKRVSVDNNGTEGNCHSYSADVSENGKYVAFISCADNLVENDTNGITNLYGTDVFVYDVEHRIIERVSSSSDGSEMMGYANFYPSISNDGRYVAFSAQAENIHPDDTDSVLDVFVHDRLIRETKLVSIDSDGNANSGSNGRHDYLPDISGDGRHVVFYGYSSLDTTNYVGQAIYTHNIQTGKTKLVGGSGGISSLPSVSKDGTWVAFISTMTDVTNFISEKYNYNQLYLKNTKTGETIPVLTTYDGSPIVGGAVRETSISQDGRYVVFNSYSDKLVENDTNGKIDMFRYDRITGKTIRVSELSDGTEINFNGNGTAMISRQAISSDGSVIVITADSDDFVSNDYNDTWDIFVTHITSASNPSEDSTQCSVISDDEIATSYQTGYDDGINIGQQSGYDNGYQIAYDKAFELGKQFCIDRPESCGIVINKNDAHDEKDDDDKKDKSNNKKEKIEICHKNKKTKHIPTRALQGHLNHGDTLGACKK